MRKLASRTAVITVTAVAVSGVGVAFAAWTTAGSGSAAPSNAKARGTLSVTPTTLAAESIYPTASFTNAVTVANSNPYAVKLASLSVTDATSTGACETDLAALEAAGKPVFTGTVANTTRLLSTGDGSSTNATVPVAVSNDLPDSCVGQAITLAFTATGASSN